MRARIVLWLGLVLLTAVSLQAQQAPTEPASVDLTPKWTAADFAGMEKAEAGILERTNRIRREHGLQAVKASIPLQIGARQHSQEMGDQNYFAHDSPTVLWRKPWQRAYFAGFWGQRVGENIVEVTRGNFATDDAIAEKFMTLWMNSPAHRENILKPEWTLLGVGVVKVGDSIYGTQLFGAPVTQLEKATLTRTAGEMVTMTIAGEARGVNEINLWVNDAYQLTVPQTGGKFTTTISYPRNSGTYDVILAADRYVAWQAKLDTATATVGKPMDARKGITVRTATAAVEAYQGMQLTVTAVVPAGKIDVLRDQLSQTVPAPDQNRRLTFSVTLPKRAAPYTISVAVDGKVEELIFVDTTKPLTEAFQGRGE